jgi:hypothetical protein
MRNRCQRQTLEITSQELVMYSKDSRVSLRLKKSLLYRACDESLQSLLSSLSQLLKRIIFFVPNSSHRFSFIQNSLEAVR